MSTPNGGLALASALAGILGLPFLPSPILSTSLNNPTTTTTTIVDTSTAVSDMTTFFNLHHQEKDEEQQHQQSQSSILPLWLTSCNYQNSDCKTSNGQMDPFSPINTITTTTTTTTTTIGKNNDNRNKTSNNEPLNINSLYDTTNIDYNNNNNSNNNDNIINNFSFILPSQQTCSDVSSDTGSVQSPYTPVQQINQSGNSNMIDSTYSSNHHHHHHKLTASSIMTTPVTSGITTSLNLDTSTMNSVNERDRKQREFIPDSKKDDKYWERRRKNNEAAKRSREKRRQNDILMECRINQLNAQNQKLHHNLLELKLRFGVPLDDEDRKFMDNLSSSSPNGGYDDHNTNANNNNNNNNSDTEMKYSEVDCCMLSTTKSRNDSLSIDDSQNEIIVKGDTLSPMSSLTTGQLPTSTMTVTPMTATNLMIPSSLSSSSLSMTTTPSSLSSLPTSLQQSNMNGIQMNSDQMSINLMTTCTTPSIVPNTHSIPSNLLFPQLNSLDNTDLLTLKRIFSSLGVGCLSPTTSSVNHPSTTPLIAAAAAAAAAAAVASNGGIPLSPIPGNTCTSVCTTSTSVPFNNLTSLNATAAMLLRQAALIPPSTPPPPSLPHPPLQHQVTTSNCGSNEINSSLPNKLPTSTSVLPLGSRCSSVPMVKSDICHNSNEYFESPLDLSLCLHVKTENNNSELVLSDSTITSDSMTMDKRYQDRRRRNNEAVRRCRENKRARMLGRTETTEKLHNENRCLRSELSGLSMEVKALRRLLSVSGKQSNTPSDDSSNTKTKQNTNNGISMDYFSDDDNDDISSVTRKLSKRVRTKLDYHKSKNCFSFSSSPLHPPPPPPPPPSSSPQPSTVTMINNSIVEANCPSTCYNDDNKDNHCSITQDYANNTDVDDEMKVIKENVDDDIEMPILTMNVNNTSSDELQSKHEKHIDYFKNTSSSSSNCLDDHLSNKIEQPSSHEKHSSNINPTEMTIPAEQLTTMNTLASTTSSNVSSKNELTPIIDKCQSELIDHNENVLTSNPSMNTNVNSSEDSNQTVLMAATVADVLNCVHNDTNSSSNLDDNINNKTDDNEQPPPLVILRGRRRTTLKSSIPSNKTLRSNDINHHTNHTTDTTTTDITLTSSSSGNVKDDNTVNTSLLSGIHHTHSVISPSNNNENSAQDSHILSEKSIYFQINKEYTTTRNSGKEDSILT
ncbi:unnamed protein product [Heterobilharzia americana]|nr:unnamed protein product [Heterobilharzia americana]